MRVYYFTSATYAIQSIERTRLKLARLADMNDPFELMALEGRTKEERVQLNDLKSDLNAQMGVLCFTKGWHNPVHWSHYGDSHKGICLGFDVPDERLNHVRYRPTRLKLGPEDNDKDFAMELITTKFSHWRYEQEARSLYMLDAVQQEAHPKTGAPLYFAGYENPGYPALELREVILGLRAVEPIERIRSLVAHFVPVVSVIQARAAFRTFRVVTDRRSLPKK